MELLKQALIALIPSIGVGFLFYKVIKSIVEGDRAERLAYAQWQARNAPTGGNGEAVRDNAERPGSTSGEEPRVR